MKEWKLKKSGDRFFIDAESEEQIFVYDEALGKRLVKLLNRSEEQKKINAELDEPSSEFITAFCDTGSTGVDCEACGRFHFTDQEKHAGEYEEKDWQELLEKAERNPDKYFYHGAWGDDYISWGYLDGIQIVANCPCNRARRYENWIWGHRYLISTYFKSMAKKWIDDAKAVADLANIDTTMLEKEDLKIEGRVQRPHRRAVILK